MRRLIDADAFKKENERLFFPYVSKTTLEELIDDAPIIDAVRVIRCKDCKHRPHKDKDGYTMPPRVQVGVYAWGEPEYDDDESCPYVCEDRWYNSVPDDEQYCDRAEPKEADECE